MDKGCSPRLVAQLAVVPLHFHVPGDDAALAHAYLEVMAVHFAAACRWYIHWEESDVVRFLRHLGSVGCRVIGSPCGLEGVEDWWVVES